MAITAASAATIVLPLPTSPCSSRFMGRGSFISSAISLITRFCALGGLERQHRLDLLAHAVVELERDAGQRPRLAPLQRDAAFQPEELLEDQPELRRRAERVQQPQVGIRRREMRLADGGPAVRQLAGAARMYCGQLVRFRRNRPAGCGA